MPAHSVVSREEWLAARKKLLRDEKALTRFRDLIAAQRRALPWVKVEKAYVFDTLEGEKALGDLFDGRSQLIIKHFMLGPGWKEGCVGCSFESDHIDGPLMHIRHHDVSFAAVARAPLEEIEAFRRRMGWRFRFVSSYRSDFNYDFNVSFTPEALAQGPVEYNYAPTSPGIDELSGFSVFLKEDDGAVYHTYSAFGRGAEEVLGAYMFLDLTPKGRNENGPRKNLTDWVRHHDRYGGISGYVAPTGRYVSDGESACCGAGGEGGAG